MSETTQILANVAPVFGVIALIVAGCLWADDKDTIRRLQAEVDDLADELERRGTRADELTKRRHERLVADMARGAVFVPGQRTGGES